MNNDNGTLSCTGKCVLAGVLIGLLAAILLGFLGGWSFFSAVVAGIVVGVIVWLLLNWIWCRPQTAMSEAQGSDAGVKATSAQGVTANSTTSSSTAASEPMATAAPDTAESSKLEKAATAETVVKPSTALAGEAELASRKGTWTYKGEAESQAPAEKAPAKKVPAKKAVAQKAPAEKAPAKAAKTKSEKAKAPSTKASSSKTAADTGAGKKPAALNAAREGGPDNLKQIKGVGPKMETLLHTMGFFHFDQVASWGADEVAWVDQNLQGFKGRATRDEWVAQAKILAEGGTTEFSSKVKKGGVY